LFDEVRGGILGGDLLSVLGFCQPLVATPGELGVGFSLAPFFALVRENVNREVGFPSLPVPENFFIIFTPSQRNPKEIAHLKFQEFYHIGMRNAIICLNNNRKIGCKYDK